MNKTLTALAIMVLIGTASSAYAAKPTTLPEKSHGKGLISKEERKFNKETTKAEKAEVKEAKKAEKALAKEAKVKNAKFYFYADTAATNVDYETDPWGQAMVNVKKASVNFNGHNLDADGEYTLIYNGVELGKGVANTEGDLHIKANLPVDVDPYAEGFTWASFELKSGDSVSLTSTDHRIKAVADEEETEEETETETTN